MVRAPLLADTRGYLVHNPIQRFTNGPSGWFEDILVWEIAPKIDTMFLMPSESHFYLSSRLIKEIAQLGGDVTRYVPAPVAARIKKKISCGGAH